MSTAPFFTDASSVAFSTIPQITSGSGPPHLDHGSDDLISTILIIFLGGIIFITLISLYEITRVFLITNEIETDIENSNIRSEKKEEIITIERATLNGTITFSLITVLTLLIFGSIIVYFLSSHSRFKK